MDATEQEIEARRKATVARARSRMRAPSVVLSILGGIQLLGGAGVAMLGSQAGSFVVFTAGAMWLLPGALVLGAGMSIRQLRGWNLVFSGLLLTVFISLLVAGGLFFGGIPGAWLPLLPALLGMVLVVWTARIEEDQEIRAARNLMYPPKPRDPVDYQLL